jgi:hypothetical protein
MMHGNSNLKFISDGGELIDVKVKKNKFEVLLGVWNTYVKSKSSGGMNFQQNLKHQ